MLPFKRQTRLAGSARARRYLALVLLGLCLAGQLSSLAHLLTVAHGLCPEHGEVVHGSGLHGTGGNAALGPAQWLEGLLPALGPSNAPAAEHDHDHCLLLSQRRGQSVPEPALRPLRAAQLATLRPLLDAAPCRVRSIALLLLAPKNSPPV